MTSKFSDRSSITLSTASGRVLTGTSAVPTGYERATVGKRTAQAVRGSVTRVAAAGKRL